MGIMSSIAQSNLTESQGKIAQMEAETQAKAEEAAGIQREADRKSRLAEALASQNAAAGAKGIAAFEGSPLSVMQEDMRQEAESTSRDDFQTQMRARTLRARGSIARDQAKAAAKIGLLSGIESTAVQIGTMGMG